MFRFFSYLANINNAGNNTTANCNQSKPQNYPSYQHHQARDEQNHEIRTTSNQKFDTVERATPPSGSFCWFSSRFCLCRCLTLFPLTYNLQTQVLKFEKLFFRSLEFQMIICKSMEFTKYRNIVFTSVGAASHQCHKIKSWGLRA